MEAMFYINEEIKKKPVIIYGTGTIGIACLYELLTQNVEVECFCSDQLELSKTTVAGKRVISIDELKETEKYNIVIAVEKYKPALSCLKSRSVQNIFLYRNAFEVSFA